MVKNHIGWVIENYEKETLTINADQIATRDVINVQNCTGTSLIIKGKFNQISLLKCNSFNLMFESLIGCVEVVNCAKVNIQVN